MTWRAFIIGLLAVIGVALVDPFVSFNKNYGWNTQGHLPIAAVFLLVVVTVGLNFLIRLIRRRSALKRPELMLIWCMLLVGCVFPSNLMRFWPPVLVAPAYLAPRADVAWTETAMEYAPDGLLLTKNSRSPAVQQFYEGWPRGEGRIPWMRWVKPMSRWAVFMAFFFGATFLMCAMLRRQWVDRERLQFPLARVPLDFTEGSGEGGWLPNLFSNRAFIIGLTVAVVFRLLRSLPLFVGADAPWRMVIPLADVFQNTPLQQLQFVNLSPNWIAMGLAYLVPADVSLSVWFFYLVGRFELLTAAWMGSPLQYGGSGSELMRWHRFGAYVAFTVGAVYMARRHLWSVVKKACGVGRTAEDADEPVAYPVAFWGFVACLIGAVLWFFYYGMSLRAAVPFLMLLMITQFVHARVVAQSGLYRTGPLPAGPTMLHSLGLGRLFGYKGVVLANMQYTVMIGGNNSMLGPAAIHAFRISEVFGRRKRWLLPALAVAVVASITAASYTCIRQGYVSRALTYSNVWSVINNPSNAFQSAHMIIKYPGQTAPLRAFPLGLGAVITAVVMFMRARFYWWPVHPIGLLAFAGYGVDRMWFAFLLGWLVKATLLKFGSGRLLRFGRFFFIGFIIGEFFLLGAWSLVSFLTGGALPGLGGWV